MQLDDMFDSLQVPSVTSDGNNFSLWGSGEWWMLLAAQSMAIGTVMVRWVSKYSDPIMATGWVMMLDPSRPFQSLLVPIFVQWLVFESSSYKN